MRGYIRPSRTSIAVALMRQDNLKALYQAARVANFKQFALLAQQHELGECAVNGTARIALSS